MVFVKTPAVLCGSPDAIPIQCCSGRGSVHRCAERLYSCWFQRDEDPPEVNPQWVKNRRSVSVLLQRVVLDMDSTGMPVYGDFPPPNPKAAALVGALRRGDRRAFL